MASVMFSLEMSKSEIVMRLLSAEAKIKLSDIFEQETHGLAAAEFQKGGHRRFQIGDERRPDHLRFAARIPRGKGVLRRLDLHDYCSVCPPTTWFNADWLMLTL